MSFATNDVVKASGSLQLCAREMSGSEATIHVMHTYIFESDDADAVLLIDASKAFNAHNRAAALHNIRILCPIILMLLTNTYRQPAQLFVIRLISNRTGTSVDDGARKSNNWLDQWQGGKLDIESRV